MAMQNHHHKQHEHEIILEFCRLLEMHDIVAAKKLITKDNINYRDHFGRGVVEIFCSYGPDDVEMLRHFVELGADFRLTYLGWSPLHTIACRNKHKLARELINLGIQVDGFNSRLSTQLPTPLSKTFVYYYNNRKTAMVLLDAGADLSLVIPKSYTAWAQNFVVFREKVRQSCVVVLGLLKCRSRVLNGESGGSGGSGGNGGNGNINGMDVLRIISRCTWELRRVEFKCK